MFWVGHLHCSPGSNCYFELMCHGSGAGALYAQITCGDAAQFPPGASLLCAKLEGVNRVCGNKWETTPLLLKCMLGYFQS